MAWNLPPLSRIHEIRNAWRDEVAAEESVARLLFAGDSETLLRAPA